MPINAEQLCDGLEIMGQPVLPLARMTQLLYLTGPFNTIAELVLELNEPIETGGITYDDPKHSLEKFIEALSITEVLKNPRPPSARILDENHESIDPMEAIELIMVQRVITNELEAINSLLCHPCGCTLCCTGPTPTLEQDFFEIPLAGNETKLFNLARIDTEESRNSLPSDEQALSIKGIPFFKITRRIVRWKTGWSMILPRGSSCPSLDVASGGCKIYPDRPDVCRRPQIFPYALEHAPELDFEYEGRLLPTYIRRNKLLAVWDCPYVKTLKDEIAQYAETCGLEPVFRENKS